MPSNIENGLLVLRVMSEESKAVHGVFEPAKLVELTGLDEQSIFAVRRYLMESSYVGAVGTLSIEMTAQGHQYLDRELRARYPVTITAERMLRHLVEDGPVVASRESIQAALNLQDDAYETACRRLDDLAFIKALTRS